MSVLVTMSDENARDFIVRAFREEGNFVDTAEDAAETFLLAKSDKYECVLVGRVLDDICGISLLDFMRKNGIETPVIILASGRNEDDALLAFEAGADDYMRHPIIVSEVVARAKAIMRRGATSTNDGVLRVCDLSLNPLTREVWRGDVKIDLQPRAYSLLKALMENAGSVVTRTELLETVWEYHFDPRSSVVETHISRLRDRIDKPFAKTLVKTIRGGGYMIGRPMTRAAA